MEDLALIDETKTRQLLEEICANLENDELLHRNAVALEKRYRKPEGTVCDLIFWKDLAMDEIIEKLVTDDVTYL